MSCSRAQERRVILLLGAPRSGTSWLANILNSHPGVVYSHEPLGKLALAHLAPITRRLTREGALSQEDRSLLLREWERAYPIHRRPPFFTKDFQFASPRLMTFAWAVLHRWAVTQKLFTLLFSPSPRRAYDLLVKEVDWATHARNIIRGLQPDLIVITRHPCAVVASELKGIQKGYMPRKDRDEWLTNLGTVIGELGFSETMVRGMEEFEWLTVCWIVKNHVYQRIVAEHGRAHVVAYEDLCLDPLAASRSLFEFLGWTMGPQTVAFLNQSTHEKSALGTMLRGKQSYFGIYRETAEAADKWKTALPPRERDRVLDMVRPFFPAYAERGELSSQPVAVGQDSR